MKPTEDSMAHVLVNYHFDPRRSICVPNVSWGFMPWEADLLVASGSRRLTEVEIKISYGDLKADLAKHKHKLRTSDRLIHKFFYAVTPAIWERLQRDSLPLVEVAGIIVVHFEPVFKCEIVRSATANKNADRLTNAQYFRLMRLGVMRYWTRQSNRFAVE